MIVNTSILLGEDFKHVEKAHLTLDGSEIGEAGRGYVPSGLDLRNYLAVPSFFNAHTHLGDSFAKDATVGLNARQAVGRRGLKWTLYESSTRTERIKAMRESLVYMLSSGTTGFSDFREYGLKGIRELREALTGLPMKSVILGRDVDERECDGLGLNLHQAGQIPPRRSRMLALHAGEQEGEVEKALKYSPDVIVHFTRARRVDIKKTARQGVSVVTCPRSNSLLKAGFPPVRELLDSKINVSLGTDNVMVSQPDMFREMEYAFTVSRLKGSSLAPVEVLRMATRNGARAFNMNSGLIEEGMNADILFLDKRSAGLRYSRNTHASIVHRCGPVDVCKVMVDGRFVLEK